MYTIAICDDEQTCIEDNIFVAQNILAELKIDGAIEGFDSAEALCNAMKRHNDKFQLLLLDIKLAEESGMELAHILRKENINTGIIFISHYDDYILEGYEVQARQYLLKPVDREKLKAAIAYDYNHFYALRPLTYKVGYEVFSVRRSEITFAESFYRKVTLHLNSGESRVLPGGLASIRQDLPARQFVHCHKSYCVNLDYVREIHRYEVILKTGETVPASKNFYEAFRDAFLEY